MNGIFLYDSSGRARVILRKDGIVFSVSGQVLAFLNNEYLYSYSGRQLGTFEDGWVRDVAGSCVLFARGATGFAPIKPICQIDPIPGIFCIPPIKPIPAIPYVKAIKSSGWSRLDVDSFFAQ